MWIGYNLPLYFFSIIGFQNLPQYTFLFMTIPSLIFIVRFFKKIHFKIKPMIIGQQAIKVSVITAFLIAYWYLIYFLGEPCEEYDLKRPLFFFSFFVLPLVSSLCFSYLYYVKDGNDLHTAVKNLFLSLFLFSCAIGITSPIAFFVGIQQAGHAMARYQISETFGALGVSLISLYGILSGIVLLKIDKPSVKKKLLIIGLIILLFVSILLSGSRMPLFLAIISILSVLYLKRPNFLMLGIFLILFYFFVEDVIRSIDTYLPFIPDITMERFFDYKTSGVDVRIKLLKDSFQAIADYPFGRNTGLSNLIGMEYSHNILVQAMLEFGLFAGILCLGLVGVAFYKYLNNPKIEIKWMGYFLIILLFQAFSAGSLYQPLFWFFIFLGALMHIKRGGNLCPDV